MGFIYENTLLGYYISPFLFSVYSTLEILPSMLQFNFVCSPIFWLDIFLQETPSFQAEEK